MSGFGCIQLPRSKWVSFCIGSQRNRVSGDFSAPTAGCRWEPLDPGDIWLVDILACVNETSIVSLSQSHTFPPVVRFICFTTSCSQSTHNFPWWNPLVPPPSGFKSTDAFSARGSIGSRQRKHRGIVSRFIQTDSRGDNENLSSRSAGSYPLTIRTRRSSRRLTLGVGSRYPGGPTPSIVPRSRRRSRMCRWR